MLKFEVNVNSKKRAVTVFVTNDFGKRFMGIAMCNPSDVFDEEKGIKIAKKRAMIALKNDDIKRMNQFRGYHEGMVNHYKACIRRANSKISSLYKEITEIGKN